MFSPGTTAGTDSEGNPIAATPPVTTPRFSFAKFVWSLGQESVSGRRTNNLSEELLTAHLWRFNLCEPRHSLAERYVKRGLYRTRLPSLVLA